MRTRLLIALSFFVLITCAAWPQRESRLNLDGSFSESSAEQDNRVNTTGEATGTAGPIEAPTGEATPFRRANAATGSGCAAGCALITHPIDSLTESAYFHLLKEFGNSGNEARTDALDALLFHARQAREFMAVYGTAPLLASDAGFLRSELSRSNVRLWLRLVDENGVVRAQTDGALFPIGRRTHLRLPSTRDLQPPEVSGTVYRTGLHHLWTRM